MAKILKQLFVVRFFQRQLHLVFVLTLESIFFDLTGGFVERFLFETLFHFYLHSLAQLIFVLNFFSD